MFNWMTETLQIVLLHNFSLVLQAWFELIKQAVGETDASQIMSNREAQHRYLTWRAEKVVNVVSQFLFHASYHIMIDNWAFCVYYVPEIKGKNHYVP